MENKVERNHGIDFLRIVSMLFIIILHTLGQGGVIRNTLTSTVQFKYVWFLETVAFVAVDIFAIISGYVSYTEKEKKVNYANYIRIWFEVVFYNLLLCTVFKLIKPEIVTFKDYLAGLLPVTSNLYWYFTAFTGLYLLMPFINKAVRNTDELVLKKILIAIIVGFSFFERIANVFNTNNGYSFVWIFLLYIIGAIIKKCHIGERLKWYHIVPTILVLYIISLLYKIYGFSGRGINVEITKNLLISYVSPTILISSILYVIWFSKMKFNKKFTNIIKFAAPASFSIYLINNNKFIWTTVMKDRFISLANMPIYKIYYITIGFSILFVIACILIDNIRIYLFKKCKINNLAEILSTGFNIIVEYFAEKIR